MEIVDKKRHAGRWLVKVKCVVCKEPTRWRREDVVLKRNNTYCGVDCLKAHRSVSIEVKCLNCGTAIMRSMFQKKNTSKNFYCSRSCAISSRNKTRVGELHPNYRVGSTSYRAKALRILKAECSNRDCIIPKPVDVRLLDVDHIDSNRKNNALVNLQVLCVYCHAVKTRITRKR